MTTNYVLGCWQLTGAGGVRDFAPKGEADGRTSTLASIKAGGHAMDQRGETQEF